MIRISWHILVAALVAGLGTAATGSAQALGTFRWQFAPYCNVVTLLVEQKGTVYGLTGTDDGCNGAAPAATANGSAHLNAGGSVGMSLSLIRPDGFTINAIIELNLGTLSGSWKDDWANNGSFVPNPVLPIAAPPRRLTMRGDWSVVFPATSASSRGGMSISFPRQLASAPNAAAANVIAAGGAPTATCPGSVDDPQAAPGHVCVYERHRGNVFNVLMWSSGTGLYNLATTTGFSISVWAAAAGNVFAWGRWAATVP